MYKLFFQVFFLLLGCILHAQQSYVTLERNISRNAVDIREVGDPYDEHAVFSPDTYDAAAILQKLPATAGALKGVFSVSNYPIIGFVPKTKFQDQINLAGLASIRLIDARFDTEKVGFSPVGNALQKKGYHMLGLQIEKKPTNWLKEQLVQKGTSTDTSGHRKLTMVLRKFWFSNSAVDRYTASNPKLITSLDYHIDIYTSQDIGYYPQTQFTGNIAALYADGNAYNVLTDSLLVLLTKQVFTNNYPNKETEANWLSPVDFNDYYTKRLKKTPNPVRTPKGVYRTYEDFLAGKPLSDSIEIIVKYNNYERSVVYASQLMAYNDGQPQSCNKCWGYYDGSSLFVNTGNGFFIKLLRTKEDFVFIHLKNIPEERIKPDLQSSIQIGNSSYQVLKDYSKAFRLTYQLDYDTGKLY